VPERLTTYFIQAHLFGESMRRDIVSKGGIVIGNDVWVGTQCVILSGARVSDGVVIGANSVVESDIPPYAIAVGSPARVVKYRFPDRIIERLLALQWWNWDDDTIRRNRRLFDAPITEGLLDQLP
jgi:acetyltransferase-like isoleucine patch superfamily enzyme